MSYKDAVKELATSLRGESHESYLKYLIDGLTDEQIVEFADLDEVREFFDSCDLSVPGD